MSTNKKYFLEQGPNRLTAIMDWKNTDHQRSIVASLIQGVYSLETKNLSAELWWTSFNFHLDRTLVDEENRIFGAIYKYNDKYASPDSNVPAYVIAFRGTLLSTPRTAMEDIKLDIKSFLHILEDSKRFKLALGYVEHFVATKGAQNVWLAGHSLGAAIALLVGKRMVLEKNWFPKAYLFNPPFLSFPIELLEHEKVKKGIRFVHCIFKAGLSLAAVHSNPRMEDHLALLSRWTPHLFVNPADILCAAYIAYFKRQVGAGETMRLAENNSMRNLFNHLALRTDLRDATHLLPSAHLVVNESHSNQRVAENSSLSDFLEAHTLSQWWHPDVRCQSTPYQ